MVEKYEQFTYFDKLDKILDKFMIFQNRMTSECQ